MNNKHLVFILLLFCALFLLPLQAGADFGDFSGDSDYGSDWDSGFDWGGSSWDDDYSFFPGGLSDGGGGVGGGSGGMSFGIILLLAVLIIFFWRRGKEKSSPAVPRPVPAGAQRTALSALSPAENYTRLDPEFSVVAFQEKLANLYVQMQNCWQNKDISSLRPYFTDAFFTQMERQLEMLRNAGRTNYVERIAVLGVDLRGYFQREGKDHMVAELRTRIVDYTLDDATGRVLSGDRAREKFMTYEWELIRSTGITTAEQKEMHKVNCPNCGAPLSINTTAKCPYCESVVTVEKHDWAISAIRGISQVTR